MGWMWLLAAVRLWAVMRVQGSWREALGRGRWEAICAALAMVLAAAWVPAVPGSGDTGGMAGAPPALVPGLGQIALEFLLGSVLGLGASLLGWALVGASRECEASLGVRAEGEESGSLARALVLASLAAALALGVHGPALGALEQLLARFPVGEAATWAPSAGGSLTPWLAASIFDACVLGLALATPVLLVRVVVDLGLGALGRGPEPARAMVDAVVPGLRLALGLLALGAAWSAYPQAFAVV